ncbi:hypothetical protein R5R35_013626 [Gryllus longicercus]|uniref:Uncharacterized protein n=1 Tax=Gryllus longicercus TaxID=2509291 RepID=A0AAN9Z8M1_9ORTH
MATDVDEVDQSVAAVVQRRQYGVYCFGLVISCLLIILIVAVIIVLLLVEGEDAKIILPVLLVLLVAIAIGSFLFIRWQHQKAVKKRNQEATEWIHRTLSQQQLATENTETVKSSWAFWRKLSAGSGNGRPIPTAPPDSANTSISTGSKPRSEGPPGYQAVSTREITV